MPALVARDLPDSLAKFVQVLIETGDSRQAAIAAGAHPDHASAVSARSLSNPLVKDAIDRAMRGKFADMGPKALKALDSMLDDVDKLHPDLRLRTINSALDRMGFDAKSIAERNSQDVDMSEMTRDQLLALVKNGEAELAERAKLANSIQPDAQTIDMES